MNKFFLYILGVPAAIAFGVALLSGVAGKGSESDKNIQITCIKKSDCEQEK